MNLKTFNQMTGIAARIILCALGAAVMCSCASPRKIIYFQDIGQNKQLKAFHKYEPAIKKDDQLSIVVSAPTKEVVAPYNLTLSDNLSTGSVMPYVVDTEGCINFPMLGKMHVEGLTRRQLEEKLAHEISKDVKDPIVNVSFLNYRVTILGEVKAPGTYTMPSERTTLLQAIGMAGDLSISANRDKVLLLRESEAGGYEYATIDLRRTDILSSPYYYMNQNDVIYVQPRMSRVSSTNLAGVISIITSSASLVLTILLLVI